jgi:hypothetical protein
MGRLTEDMTRLVGEIHAARDGRGRLMRDLKHATVEMKNAVAGMQARSRAAHADMARRQQRTLRDFASGLRATVAGVRKEFAVELAGARRAWFGTMTAAMPGRARRGGKWFGGESA